jgi:EAL domain-containing protein (putative c-di-GMP-specific phosphodiesterase class I)
MGLVFQPIVNLRENHAEHYEVLLRMRNEDERELLPEVVFTSIHKLRLGLMLDRWVIAHCLPVLRKRRQLGLPTKLFINLSPAILQDNDLTVWLQEGFSKAQVDPGNLIFELPETTAAQHLQTLQTVLAPLKKLGCGLSLDHFGRHGERSLQLLNSLAGLDLAVDYVKPDPIFIHDLVNDEDKQQQLKDWIATLKTLNITPIVSAIEDLPTLNILIACGIEYAQGYFLQPPQAELNYDHNGSSADRVIRAANP